MIINNTGLLKIGGAYSGKIGRIEHAVNGLEGYREEDAKFQHFQIKMAGKVWPISDIVTGKPFGEVNIGEKAFEISGFLHENLRTKVSVICLLADAEVNCLKHRVTTGV